MTTLEMEGCAEREMDRTGAAIEKEARVVFSLLSANGRREFVRAERSWLAYRTASCRAVASKYAGGSIAPVMFGTCVVHKNRSHLTELSVMRRDLEFH